MTSATSFSQRFFLPWAMALSVVAALNCDLQASSASEPVEEMTKTQHASKMSEQRTGGIRLLCSLTDYQLTLRVVNRCSTSIVIDKDLVFLVQITAKDKSGRDISIEEVKCIPNHRPVPTKERLIRLAPGNEIKRTIDLRHPFRVFVTAKSFPQYKMSAYEAMWRVTRPKEVSVVYVRYGPHYGFQDGFQYYTGQSPKDVHLFLGPCECRVANEP